MAESQYTPVSYPELPDSFVGDDGNYGDKDEFQLDKAVDNFGGGDNNFREDCKESYDRTESSAGGNRLQIIIDQMEYRGQFDAIADVEMDNKAAFHYHKYIMLFAHPTPLLATAF